MKAALLISPKHHHRSAQHALRQISTIPATESICECGEAMQLIDLLKNMALVTMYACCVS